MSLFHATYTPSLVQSEQCAVAALTLSISNKPVTAPTLTEVPGLRAASSWISAFSFFATVFNVCIENASNSDDYYFFFL